MTHSIQDGLKESNVAIEDFRAKIKSYNLWQAYEVKTCLLKYSDADIEWKIGFAQIQLIEDRRSAVIEVKLDEKRVKLIREDRDVSSIDILLDELKRGVSLNIGGHTTALKLMTGHVAVEFHDRDYTSQNYNIEYPAFYLVGNGVNSPELEATRRDLEDVLGQRNPPLKDLHHACDAMLGIDFGSGSVTPFVLILAPLQVRIDTAILDDSVLRIVTKCSPASEISNVRLVAIGVDEKDKPTEFSHSITTFQPLPHDSSLFSWITKSDDKSLAVRLTLHHKEKKLADILVRKTLPTIPDVSDVVRVKVADALLDAYNDADRDSGAWYLPRFNARVEEIFGNRPLGDSPLDGKKQMRGYIKSLSSKELWNLLQYLSQEDNIENQLSIALKGSGIAVTGGELVRTADIELGVYKTNEVISELQKLRWNDVAKLLEDSANDLAANDPISASSKAGLAFDSVARKALSLMGFNSRGTLGTLANELVTYGVAEKEMNQTLQSLANLRNIQGGHSGAQGKINFSVDIAYVSTYLSRICIGYVIRRLRALSRI